MNTDFILWTVLNNLLSGFGQKNIYVDILLALGMVYFFLPFYIKNTIRRFSKDCIYGIENKIEFSFDNQNDSPGSKRFKAIARFIETNSTENITSVKELPDNKWDSKLDTYKEEDSIYQVNQYNKFNITDEIFGRVYDSKEDVKTNHNQYQKTITTFEIVSYTKTVKDLIEWTEDIYHKYETDIDRKFQRNQYLIRVTWDNEDKYIDTDCEPWESKINFQKMYFPNKDKIIKKIDFFLNNKDWYDEKGIPWKLGIMLYGSPGTGKTTFVRSLINYTGRHVVDIKLTPEFPFDKLSSVIGGKLGKNIVMQSEKFLIVIEDIDTTTKILHNRQKENDADGVFVNIDDINKKKSPKRDKQKDENTLSQFLNDLDGIRERPGSIIIFTTNHIEKLDPAIFRPGRVDININMDRYSRDDIYELCKYFWKDDFKYTREDINPELIGSKTSAELINIFRSSDNFDDIKDELISS